MGTFVQGSRKPLPELTDVASDLQNLGHQAALSFDRPTASRLGITPQNIDDSLYDSFGQRQVSTIFTQLNQYHVILEVDPNFQVGPENLKDIYLMSAGGGAVPLSAVTKTSQVTAPILISRYGAQFPATTVLTVTWTRAPRWDPRSARSKKIREGVLSSWRRCRGHFPGNGGAGVRRLPYK